MVTDGTGMAAGTSGEVEGRRCCLVETELVWDDGKALDVGGGDICMGWIFLMPLNYTAKNS